MTKKARSRKTKPVEQGTISPVETVKSEREVHDNIVRHADELVAYADRVRQWATEDGIAVEKSRTELSVNAEFLRAHLHAIEKLHAFQFTYYYY